MTNEEKAKEIIKISDTKEVYDIVDFQSLEEALKDDLMEMAKWKDEQFMPLFTKENWKRKLPFIQAFINGDTVQWYDGENWCDLENGDFTDAWIRYRIKPKPFTVEGRIKKCQNRLWTKN